jgi:hypothetical protein
MGDIQKYNVRFNFKAQMYFAFANVYLIKRIKGFIYLISNNHIHHQRRFDKSILKFIIKIILYEKKSKNKKPSKRFFKLG